ncbi:MAG: hypothetical protein ABIU77_07010 [Ferruginibacter sp.]
MFENIGNDDEAGGGLIDIALTGRHKLRPSTSVSFIKRNEMCVFFATAILIKNSIWRGISIVHINK